MTTIGAFTDAPATSATPCDEELRLFFDLLERLGRAGGLTPDDVSDFVQGACVKLLESDYLIFRRFQGQSSLRTYLTVVAGRLLADWKNQAWGKWRPSAAAARLGPDAITLERYTHRDGLTSNEAVHLVHMRPQAPATRELRALVEQLPARRPRRRVADDLLEQLPGPRFADPVVTRQHADKQARRMAALRQLCAQMPPADQRLIEARYLEGQSVTVVAGELGQDAKQIYRRCERLLRDLRRHLCAMGLGQTLPLGESSYVAR